MSRVKFVSALLLTTAILGEVTLATGGPASAAAPLVPPPGTAPFVLPAEVNLFTPIDVFGVLSLDTPLTALNIERSIDCDDGRSFPVQLRPFAAGMQFNISATLPFNEGGHACVLRARIVGSSHYLAFSYPWVNVSARQTAVLMFASEATMSSTGGL